MTDTKTGEQSTRRAARQTAVAAQARRRAKEAERDKRLDAAALTLIVTLKERDAHARGVEGDRRPMLLAVGARLGERRPGPQLAPCLTNDRRRRTALAVRAGAQQQRQPSELLVGRSRVAADGEDLNPMQARPMA